MKTVKNLKVPTGNICIVEGEKGLLEFLSIGDYGKNANIKADFLGIKRELNGVPSGEIQPLEDKWVITLSTQYGCNSKCVFCDVPKVGKGINATYNDLVGQIESALSLHPDVKKTERLNIHYARMGEPSWNPNVIKVTKNLKLITNKYIGDSKIHPVFTTMFPKNNKLLIPLLLEFANLKNNLFKGDAGIQFSINSTDNKQRNEMFGGSSLTLEEISEIGKILPHPIGRKYTINIALADEYIIDEYKLKELFPTDRFMVKITPLHRTISCDKNDIKTSFGYTEYTPYRPTEERLKAVGYDVLVFIPSVDEDLGRITCGNVILSGSLPETKYKIID